MSWSSLMAETRPLIRFGSRTVSYNRELALASSIAAALPAAPSALNLCERRENFLAGFAALLMRGQACLLPPSRAPAVVAEVEQEHPGCCRLDDAMVEKCRDEAGARQHDVLVAAPAPPPERVVVVGYTSGSTGRPKANPKTWGSLVASTRFNAARLREALGERWKGGLPWILATVPSQHMYGMETAVLLPLVGGMGLHGGHPLYPADITSALRELPEPRVLVTTPVHLRALLRSGIELPPLGAVVSATAPLLREMAAEVEKRFDTILLEFFGSTETCVIASRRTAVETAWRPYPGVVIHPGEDCTRIAAPWLAGEVVLQDMLEAQPDGGFVVLGRNSDMVEVGGKRASLADLTRRIASIPGVTDAVVFQPDATVGAVVQRLAALAVVEGLTEAELLARLAPLVDPVFLPRPLLLVPRLPRNELGKLPREQLLAALQHR